MKVIYWWEKIKYPRGWVFPLFSQEVKMHLNLSGWLSHGNFRAATVGAGRGQEHCRTADSPILC